ncbi:NTP transferase domain-containing protein [Patescibacteria group bacterium]
MKENLTPDILLLAGGDLVRDEGVYKHLNQINGKPIISRVLSALDASETSGQVFVAGPEEVLGKQTDLMEKSCVLVGEGGSFMGNLKLALDRHEKTGSSDEILVVSSDLPFLRPETIDWISSNFPETDIGVPIVGKSNADLLMPHRKYMYWPMKDESFVFGNVYSAKSSSLRSLSVPVVDEYRASQASSMLVTGIQRMLYFAKLGNAPLFYSIAANYVSKTIQMIEGVKEAVPLSNLRTKNDYEKVLSRTLGLDVGLFLSPAIDLILDVDAPGDVDAFNSKFAIYSDIVGGVGW